MVAGAVAAGPSFESIQTVSLSAGSASSVEFTSIPATYKHLQIRAIGQSTRNIGTMDFYIQVNSDTGTNYSFHQVIGNGTAVSSAVGASQTKIQINNAITNSTNTSIFSAVFIDVLDYANTNKYKTFRSLSGRDINSAGQANLGSGLWQSTSAITSLKFTPETFDWSQYSHFALYGIKGA